MSTMRWGDSDSSDEDEIRVSSLPVPGQRDDNYESLPRQPQRRRSPPRSAEPPQRRSNMRDRPTKSFTDNRPGYQHNKRGDNRGNRRQQQPPQDWKAMAKSASRFSSSAGSHDQAPLDGSSWMAQRRKKMEEQNERERQEMEKRQKQLEEEKRSQRKSQLDALKAAVKEMKAESSLQQAAARSHPEPQPPTRILTRPTDQKPYDPKQSRAKTEEPKMWKRAEMGDKASKPKPLVHERSSSPDHSAGDDQSSSTASSLSRRARGRGRGGHGGGGRGRGRSSERGREGRSTEQSDRSDVGGRSSTRGRGGGRRGGSRDRGAGRVKVGSTQVVRTASGNIEYHVSLENQEEDTKGELLPNGTVRLSKKKKKRGGKGRARSPKHTSIQTKLEIGKEESHS